MTWPPPYVPLEDLPHADYRSAVVPSEILPERRLPAPVGSLQTGPRRTYNDLSQRDRYLFNAQLAAWRAAVALVHEVDTWLTIGRHSATDERVRFGTALGDLARQWDEARFNLMNEKLRRH